MYYCTSSTAFRSCIGYAVCKNVDGPYTYVDTLIYSGFTKTSNPVTTTSNNMGTKTVDTWYTNTNIVDVYKTATQKTDISVDDLSSDYFNGNNYNTNLYPNAIDPAVFYDKDGGMWMAYGSWSCGIYLLELDPATGQAIHPTASAKDGNVITDIYFGKKIAGGYGQSEKVLMLFMIKIPVTIIYICPMAILPQIRGITSVCSVPKIRTGLMWMLLEKKLPGEAADIMASV